MLSLLVVVTLSTETSVVSWLAFVLELCSDEAFVPGERLFSPSALSSSATDEFLGLSTVLLLPFSPTELRLLALKIEIGSVAEIFLNTNGSRDEIVFRAQKR